MIKWIFSLIMIVVLVRVLVGEGEHLSDSGMLQCVLQYCSVVVVNSNAFDFAAH